MCGCWAGGLGRGALFKRSIPPEREKRERGKRNGIRNANARKEGNGTDRRAAPSTNSIIKGMEGEGRKEGGAGKLQKFLSLARSIPDSEPECQTPLSLNLNCDRCSGEVQFHNSTFSSAAASHSLGF